MSDKRFDLTRRKALMGLGGIGAGAALGGTGTMAFLNDREKTSAMMTAGTLDLQLDWYTFYKGREEQTNYKSKGEENGPIWNLSDCKPGDYGCGVISVHVDGNPAHVWYRTKNPEQGEGDWTEPERKVDETPEKGELAKHVKFVTVPIGCFEEKNYEGKETAKNHLPHGSENRPSMDDWTTDEETAKNGDKNYCYTKGTLADLLYGGGCGTYLPSKKDKTCLYGFCWWIPKHVGNKIQGDWLEFDMEFYAEQKRHNRNPENPWHKGDLKLNEDSPGLGYHEKDGSQPYIRWDIDGHEVELSFYNPSDYTQWFDYRVDEEPGYSVEYSDQTIEEGPMKGQKFGNLYNVVEVPKNSEKHVTVEACETLATAVHIGPEQNWYIPWIRFEAEE